MQLFSKGPITDALNQRSNRLANQIESISDNDIVNSNLEELTEYYAASFDIDTIELYKGNISKSMTEIKIRRHNPYYGRMPYENEYYDQDGYKVTYIIPFDGDLFSFDYHSSTHYVKTFDVDKIINPTNEQPGKILYSLEFTCDELQKKDGPTTYVDSRFNSEFKYYIETINRVNSDIIQYNARLRDFVISCINKRKQKATEFMLLSEKLNIPLKLSGEAPNIKPIPLRKGRRETPQRPTAKPTPKEYSIELQDYSNIKSIINLAGNSFEKTAQTFKALSEEALRDVILSNLNTHYQGTATGETFSKVGKTDIKIQFENKSAYIGECKIWHGEKKFHEALLQLFSYATWRDSKTSLILFNKYNKDFMHLLIVVDDELKKSTLCKRRLQLNKNEWECVFNKAEDTTEEITVHIVVFDLFVEGSVFKTRTAKYSD